ncbi:MAG: hypothetical protein AB1847_23135 [bacterium]
MKYIICLIILLGLFFTGCDKDSSPSNTTPEQQVHVYPLAVGNRWIYSGGDTILIDGTATLNGKTAHHILGDDDYTLGERNLYYEGNMLYGWDGADTVASPLFDEITLQTLTVENVTVPAGTFETYKYSWGTATTKIYWFRKGGGVVKANLNGDIRELIAYTLH